MRNLRYGIALALPLALGWNGLIGLPLRAQVPAGDRVFALLRELTQAPGPPGFEEPVARIMAAHFQPYVNSMRYDGLGSLIAEQKPTGAAASATDAPRIMVDAHMDELGGMVRRLTPDGFLTMQMLGGWLDVALPGQRWVIIGSHGPVHAITNIPDAHIATADQRTHLVPRDAIFLDVGAHTAAQARALGLEPGDPVVPDSPLMEMNGTGNYVAKAWDDRIGCAVMLEAARQLATLPHPNDIFYAATVQEEIGERGAATAAEVIKPDLGLALEAGITRDMPGVRPDQAQEVLGGGPGIFLWDTSELPNRKLVAFIEETARAEGIPLQTDLVGGYGDDSSVIQKSNGGVPTANLVVPTRYTHVHNGEINRGDFDGMVKLMVALLQRLDAPTVARLRAFGAPAGN